MSPRATVELILRQGPLTHDQVSVLSECINWTTEVWAGWIDHKFIAAWGLAPMTMLTDRAYLWLWAQPNIPHQLTFIRYSKRMVEHMLEHYPVIYGLTDPHNHKAKKWLEWLGARYTVVRNDGLLAFEIHRRAAWQTQSA